MDKQRRYICAAMAAFGNSVDPVVMRELRKKKHTLKSAVDELGKATNFPATEAHHNAARKYSTEFIEYTDDEFGKTWPILAEQYSLIPKGAVWSGKKERAESDVPHLLAQLNAIKANSGQALLKRWSRGRTALVQALDKARHLRLTELGQSILHLLPRNRKVKAKDKRRIEMLEEEARKLSEALGITWYSPRVEVTNANTVVAEGAYENERDAAFRTGHTTTGRVGRRRHLSVEEGRQALESAAKHVAKAKPDRVERAIKRAARTLEEGETTLADIAKSVSINPKVARSKARTTLKDFLTNLEVEGKKYIFKSSDAKKIGEALKKDARAK